MLDHSTLQGRIIEAALKLAAARRWREITLLDIAEAAGTSLAELRTAFASKSDIVAGFVRATDASMLKQLPKRAEGEMARDRLFEVIMSRLDVLGPHKAAVRSITADAGLDPMLAPSFFSTQRWMLEAAGVGSDGAGGALRTAGLATVYASVLRTWLDDDDPGLARTMAALDRRLRRGERTLSRIEDTCDAIARLGSSLTSIVRGRGASAPRPEPPPSPEVSTSAGSRT